MQIIVPRVEEPISWDKQVQAVASKSNLPPFHEEVISFLNNLSKSILLDKAMRSYPELMAMAHWLRKGHILELKARYEAYEVNRYLLARGTVVHFAPANVDSVFIYSWILSMLAGNKNIVRLSRRKTTQTDILMQRMNALLARPDFGRIAERTMLVRYNYEIEFTTFLSDVCQLRVIWGGDRSVEAIRSCPLPPNALELVFPDRYSKAVIQASAIDDLDEGGLRNLAKRFYNDALWYGQMACSSPKEVYWIGEEKQMGSTVARFWSAVNRVVGDENYRNDPTTTMLRLATADFYATLENTGQILSDAPQGPLRVPVLSNHDIMRSVHCGGGLFLEYHISTLNGMLPFIHDRDQTISYFGLSKEELVQFIKALPGRGVDRVVPIGQALQFDSIWDGYDLFVYFTREVAVY